MAADFVALGGVWLDEIRKAGNTLRTNVVGGSVTYGKMLATSMPVDAEHFSNPWSTVILADKARNDSPGLFRGHRISSRST